jgi:hypothetical protein
MISVYARALLYSIPDIDTWVGRHDNPGQMSEHGFLATMLAVAILEVLILGLALGYFTYRISRVLDRVKGIGTATYLEIRKTIGQPR